MKLYEIEQAILDCIDDATGEIIDFERLNQLNIDRHTKIDNIISLYKALTADAIAIDSEIRALKERQNQKINKSESLKQWLSVILDGSRFESSRNYVSWRRSDEVNILNEVKIPAEYKTENVEISISKSDIKKDIKDGITVDGAELVFKNNIQIK